MKHFNSIYTLFFILVFTACNENLEMEPYQHQIVVDGWIENGGQPIVALTISSSFFADIDSISIRDYIITGAKVTLSDGFDTEIMTLTKNPKYFPPYVYKAVQMRGVVGRTYNLKVEYAGRVVTAQTTIPKPPQVDSVWFSMVKPETNDGVLIVKMNDPADEANYYRFFTFIEDSNAFFIPTFFPNVADVEFNGQEVELPVYQGNEYVYVQKDNIYFKSGTDVVLKVTSIDDKSYRFWTSYQAEILNAGNPFASSNARIESNVTGGLGIWCGYAVRSYKVKTAIR